MPNLFDLKAAQTHCINGHEFTPENTYERPAGAKGNRDCRTCRRTRAAKSRALKPKKPRVPTPKPQKIPPPRKTPEQVFWSLVTHHDGHLLWKGPTDGRTRQAGRFTLYGVHYAVRKLSMQLAGHPTSKSTRYVPICGQEQCVLPDHLEDLLTARARRVPRCPVCKTPTAKTINPDGFEVEWGLTYCYLCTSEVDRLGESIFLAKMRREGRIKCT